MKYSKKITLILVFGILFLSTQCTEEYLTIKPENDQLFETLFSDSTSYNKATVSIYDAFQTLYSNSFPTIIETRADDIENVNPSAGGGIQSAIDYFAEQTNNSFLNDVYRNLYGVIARSNLLLNKIKTSEISEASKKQYIGEASFLRALAYFHLVRLFGGVPIILDPINVASDALQYNRSSAKEVYTQIISDLTTSVDNLNLLTTPTGRVDKEAATALLGKVYLTMQDWQNAINTLRSAVSLHIQKNNTDSMMNTRNYGTVATSIFSPTAMSSKEEVIFAIGFSTATGEGGNFLNTINNTTNIALTTSYKSVAFNLSVVDSFRRNSTGSAVAAKPRKFPTTGSANQANAFPVLRYTDVLLMLAEALNEEGYNGTSSIAITNSNAVSMPSANTPSLTAFDLLNRVRARANVAIITEATMDNYLVSSIPTVSTLQEKFRKLIFEERRREFFLECNRWYDIIRYGTGGINEKTGLPNTSFGIDILKTWVPNATQNRLLYPIPQQEIDVHNDPVHFPQNAGY